jgi:beta-N-acetylhexosaminidase
MKKIIQALMLVCILILQSLSTSINTSNIGQRFIITLPANQNFEQLATWLEQIKPGGVMLTAPHMSNRAQTKKLCTFLQDTAHRLEIDPLFICIDWEGGVVSRPNENGGFFSVPSPWSLAQAGRPACFLAGMLIGHQLASVGVNVDFAPSLDLFTPQNYILATRCFDLSPEKTAEYGIAFAQGLLSQGVLPVIKHFPGLGLGVKDTHLDQTIITVDKKLFDQHKQPFERALQTGIPMIMAGHAIYSQFGDQPVTLNKNATDYLKKINPEALLITDDFCMQGVRENRTLEDALMQSLSAGYHLIIFSPAHAPEFIKKNSSQVQLQTLLKNLSSMCNKAQIQKGLEHIARIKEKYLAQKASFTNLDEKELSMFLAKRCLQTDNIQQQLTGPLTLISLRLPKIRTTEPWFIDNEQSYLCKKLNTQNIQVQEHVLDPTSKESVKELETLIAQFEKNPTKKILLQTMFYGGGAWNEIQKQWLEKLAPLQDQLIILSLGHPYEQTILPDVTVIHIGSFQKPLLDNLVNALCVQPLQTGADKLAANPEQLLTGKKFGLLCHRCSVAQTNGVFKIFARYLKRMG